MAEEYTCTLSEASLEKAKQELNEDPTNRLGAVQTFREWIEQQQHLTCITSTEYLLPFLRTAKFSQLRAREILEGYLNLTTEQAKWYKDLDPMDEHQLESLKSGVMLPLGFDYEGRMIILFREGAITHEMNSRMKKDKKYKANIFKGFVILLKYLLFDENVQVNGFIMLEDFTGYTMSHFTTWSMEDIKEMMKWQGNYPGRYKGFYYYNTGAVFETIMELVMPFMGKKMKERMKMLGNNLENVYKVIPKEILPAEYLPDDYDGTNPGTVDDIRDNFINQLHKPEIRDRIVYESRSEWTIDKSKKDADVPVASFRKLNVD